MKKRLAGLLKDIASSSVVIVGDVMLDEYIIGDSSRISPEAPGPVIDEKERIALPGGAANVAVNVTSLGANALLFGIVGNDPEGEIFKTGLREAGVDDSRIVTIEKLSTTRKTRLIARGNQVLRVDRETPGVIDSAIEERFIKSIGSLSEEIVIISDYAKGVVTSSLIRGIIETGKRVIIDPKSRDFSMYAGAYLLTPNHTELCRAAGAADIPSDNLEPRTREIMDTYDIANILVTLGSEGMILIENGAPATHIHTRAREVYDVTGAGDTVIATVSSAIAAGAGLEDACNIATIAAGIVVGKHKTATATPSEILAYAFGPSASEKIVDGETLIARSEELRKAGRKIVFTNGCFDLLHIGHITYLKESRELGDILIVGLNTDSSVRRLKGENRPIISEDERSHVLAALECVDYVVLFDEDTPIELIKAVRPDILVKGADYTVEEVVGHEIVESYGGRVHLMPIVGNMSTSTIINRIKNNF